jgi:transcription elongation factor S-II
MSPRTSPQEEEDAADRRQEAADKRQEAADRRADARRVREEDRRADARRESEDRVPAVRAKAAARVRVAVDGDADLAARIEKATWNWTLRAFPPRDRYWDNARLRFRYTTKILSMCFNVRHPLNPDLRASVLQGEVGPGRLVRMSPYELFPAHWAEVFDRVAHKQLRKQITMDAASAPDGLLQCRKCKSRKTTYTQLQTRSADEPLTTFALCLECGARWKE